MFEAWAKLTQQWLVCVPLGLHLEQLRVNAVSDNVIILNCTTGPNRELCSAKKELFGPMVRNMSLSETLD